MRRAEPVANPAESGGTQSWAPARGSLWHNYRMEVQGNNIRLWIDGALLLETTDSGSRPRFCLTKGIFLRRSKIPLSAFRRTSVVPRAAGRPRTRWAPDAWFAAAPRAGNDGSPPGDGGEPGGPRGARTVGSRRARRRDATPGHAPAQSLARRPGTGRARPGLAERLERGRAAAALRPRVLQVPVATRLPSWRPLDWGPGTPLRRRPSHPRRCGRRSGRSWRRRRPVGRLSRRSGRSGRCR